MAKNIRTIIDKELRKLLEENGRIIKKGRKIDAQLTKLEKEEKELIEKHKEIEKKITNILDDKYVETWNLGEFEVPGKIELKGQKILIEIKDLREELEDKLREQIKKDREAKEADKRAEEIKDEVKE